MAEIDYQKITGTRKDPTETKNVRVVTTDTSKAKKTIASKLSDNLAELKTVNLKQQIVDDVIEPGVKGFFSDLIGSIISVVGEVALNASDILIWGEEKKRRKKNGNTSYSSYYDKKRSGSSLSKRNESRNTLDFDDISFRSKVDAKEVLDQLRELCDEYDAVSVAEFYRSVGMDHSFADEKYGWTNLTSAYISRTRDGRYVINLPKARALD